MNIEEIVIGQILIQPDIFHSSRLKPEHFGDTMCRRAFEHISRLFSAGIVPDLLSVTENKSDVPVGWWAKQTSIPSAANYSFYEDDILEAYRMREYKVLKSELEDWLMKCDSGEITENIDKRLQAITALTDKDRIYKASELALPFINDLEERFKNNGKLPGISSGLSMLDEHTLGFQPKLKYEIGGRPSDGKSALMVTLICNIGFKQKIPTGVISLESSKNELFRRLIANTGSINSQNLQTGLITRDMFGKTSNANAKAFDAPVYFYDVPNLSLAELKVQSRRMVRQHGVKIIFIDYEQLVEIPGVHNTLDRATEVSISIKSLARELDIPIVSLAQMKRDSEGKKPKLSSFSDSSQIEKDADGAILIWHNEEKNQSYLCVAKMRDGRTGDIPVYFDRPHVRFTEQEYGRGDK